MGAELIIIPHKLGCSYTVPITYSPFHRWEHIFIRFLSNHYLHKYNIKAKIYAKTTFSNTKIYISVNDNLNLTDDVDLIKSILKEDEPCKSILKNEVKIIDRELKFISKLYGRDMKQCEYGNPLNKEQMLDFRKIQYRWDDFYKADNTISKNGVNSKIKEEIPHVNQVENIRSKLIHKFSITNYIKTEDKQRCKEENFLMTFVDISKCKYVFNKFNLKERIKNLDKYINELSIYITSYPYSPVIWVTYENINKKDWLTVYLFGTYEDAAFVTGQVIRNLFNEEFFDMSVEAIVEDKIIITF